MVAYQKRLHPQLLISPKPCVWCGQDGHTRDHWIPQWFSNKFLRRTPPGVPLKRIDPACFPCNSRKGPLPPIVYAKFSCDPELWVKGSKTARKWRREVTEWCAIANYFGRTRLRNVPEELLHYVVETMFAEFELPEVPDLAMELAEEQERAYEASQKVQRKILG